MPINDWSRKLWDTSELKSSDSGRFESTESEIADESKRRSQLTREILRLYGFKPWTREDRRNRPLRTKRSWVSTRARVRECEIIRLRCGNGLTFREIGQRLGISHVAAWKRFEWALENIRMSDAYERECIREIFRKMEQVTAIDPAIEHYTPEDRRRMLEKLALIPPRQRMRKRTRSTSIQ